MIFKQKKQVPVIKIADAKNILKKGMTNYLGGIPEWSEEYDSVAEWLKDSKGKGLLAVGKKGRGKTVICMDVLPDILESIGMDYVKLSSYAMSRNIERIFNARVLILDDIGVEDIASSYGERHDLFVEVVDHAERESVLLIVTTNLTFDELIRRYGERIVDRLKGLVTAVVFDGESLRGKELKQPSYAFGIAFDTEKEADDFEKQQLAIREGIENGQFTFFDDWAREAYELNEAIELRDNVVYKHNAEAHD